MQITRGRTAKAQKVVIYGVEGIGKTTLASQFPDAVFVDVEGSTANYDVARYPVPNCWANLIQIVQYARENPQNQKTLVIDTADWAEKLCAEAVCAKAGKSGIEDFGYGRGYTYLMEEFVKFLTHLDGLIDAGIHVVLTAHAITKKVELPDELGAYDKWELKLTKFCVPKVKEWADIILFCNYKTFVVSGENGKGKAQGGRRVMYTEHHPCWDAKNRHDLPAEMPMDYGGIAHIFAGTAPSVPSPVAPPMPQPVQAVPPAYTPPPVPDPEPVQMTIETPKPADNSPQGQLARLMENAGVYPAELQLVVGAKGYFPPNCPVDHYPDDFLMQCLIPAWEQVYQMILADREDVPFN